ncbi:MAG: DUF2071 domain-containing protein [Bacteroidia bacterium]|nr:DUF2071 domain-containing protein [Bacteroidia bacterium]
MPFLTATWSHLLNVTFPVPPEILLPHVPPGVELDVQDGHAFASVVAFDFLDTRVKGLKIPFHINFPEINLRYYIRHNGKRGVMFWKELVPKYCIAFVARRFYNEPYEAVPMSSAIYQEKNDHVLNHTFFYGGKSHNIMARFSDKKSLPPADSVEYYFKEHDLGIGVSHKGKPLQYEVRHPEWEIFKLKNYRLDIDFGLVYGKQWAFLANTTPHCALLAVGSKIEVFPPEEIIR